jgi:4-hydroxy-tetrahydrodipicolinate reductase
VEIVLVGYGKMGKEVEQIALQRNHKIIAKYDIIDQLEKIPSSNSVCIDFTTPEAFIKNYQILANKFDAVVVGTTGWDQIKDEVIDYFTKHNKTLVYASNFSIGVNVFFEAIKTASQLLGKLNYEPYIIEMHHKEKKDAPSGTAKSINKILSNNFSQTIQPASVRCGKIRGIHEVGFESDVDKICLRHEAYSRQGFATGAVLAAEWINNITGIWDFHNLLMTKLTESKE